MNSTSSSTYHLFFASGPRKLKPAHPWRSLVRAAVSSLSRSGEAAHTDVQPVAACGILMAPTSAHRAHIWLLTKPLGHLKASTYSNCLSLSPIIVLSQIFRSSSEPWWRSLPIHLPIPEAVDEVPDKASVDAHPVKILKDQSRYLE